MRTSSSSKHEISSLFSIFVYLFCPLHPDPDSESGARNYRQSFRENKPKTLVFYDWKRAFWACFREYWVYKFGHYWHWSPLLKLISEFWLQGHIKNCHFILFYFMRHRLQVQVLRDKSTMRFHWVTHYQLYDPLIFDLKNAPVPNFWSHNTLPLR